MPSSPAVSTPPIRRKGGGVAGSKSVNYAESPQSDVNSPLRPNSRATNVPARATAQHMNDDVSEKAARRKSAHFGELGESGPRLPGQQAMSGGAAAGGAAGKRVVSALAVQQQQKRAKRLSAVAPSGPPVSMEVMSTNFEEWMKLATDNKITANNTWNFALIDYFADLTLLRNGPDDQSINFQKASCTLDGCVKIWTSRVDSVATETGKLLSGLAGGPEDETEAGEDGEDEDGAEPSASKRKAPSHRSEATLAKSFAALQIKKFDLEFTVDPLFKKTSADFDEGGAMGLLMNHLGVDSHGRVVFDAGDAVPEDEDEGELPPDEEIDLDRLREYIPTTERIQDLQISDTLASFKFSSDPDAMPDFATLVGLRDFDDDQSQLEGSPAIHHGEEVDFFGGEDYDMPGPSGFDDGMSMAGDDGDVADGAGPSSGGGLAMAGPGDHHGPFDPRRQGGELVMALMGGEGGDEGMFDYFDKGFGKAWAGAEHWKLRKVSRKDATPAAGAVKKDPKAAKQAFQIDFTAVPGPSSKTLFAAAPKSTISLPAPRRSKRSSNDAKKRKEEYLLPDDMHFSSRQLLRLFMKPKFSLRMRRNGQAARIAGDVNGEIDENFWAQAAADRAEGDLDMDGDSRPPNPFESQFFHDDATDMGDYADVDDALDPSALGGGDEDDLWQGSQGIELKKSRPENVNFAKKAKRVDVKRLKDDIWTGLRGLVADPKPPVVSSDEEPESDAPVTPKDEVKTFDTIITDLRQSYPQEKMSEISTSFCFICLLHLANEEGLRIETARFDGQEGDDVGCQGLAEGVEVDDLGVRRRMDQGERTDRVVGELQALRVYKDPNAGRAA